MATHSKLDKNIYADLITCSTHNNHDIHTFELQYPRFIHSEFMTHRVFSRNAASSRAIPVESMIQLVIENPAMPVHWGRNQRGMQAQEESDALVIDPYSSPLEPTRKMLSSKEAWLAARDKAVDYAWQFHRSGFHKQVINRLLEPFTFIKVIMTTTELSNFFLLRDHEDAQPEIRELAKCIHTEFNKKAPVSLGENEWHLPYIDDELRAEHELGDLLKISASACAQISYRKNDLSVEKARRIYDHLVVSSPPHASPFEHQAKPIPPCSVSAALTRSALWRMPLAQHLPKGVTHFSYDSYNLVMWSGNFKHWIQHRQLLPHILETGQIL